MNKITGKAKQKKALYDFNLKEMIKEEGGKINKR